jgi:hypothetical protein
MTSVKGITCQHAVALFSNKEFIYNGGLAKLINADPEYQKSHYTVLGVDLGISETGYDGNAITKAYRTMALRHHPDKGGDAEVFKAVNEAHEVLSDPVRRAEYDRELIKQTVLLVAEFYDSLPHEDAKNQFRTECAKPENRIKILQKESHFWEFVDEVVVGADDAMKETYYNTVFAFVTNFYNLKDFYKLFLGIFGWMGTGKSTNHVAVIMCSICGFNIDAVLGGDSANGNVTKNDKLFSLLHDGGTDQSELRKVVMKYAADSARVYDTLGQHLPLYAYVSIRWGLWFSSLLSCCIFFLLYSRVAFFWAYGLFIFDVLLVFF